MASSKFTEAPPRCQLHSMGCQGFCETKREVELELCQKCLELRDARFSGAMGDVLHFGYTNYRGEYAERRATPIRFEFTRTEHHPEEQWIMYAMDHDKGYRAFAVADMVIGNRPILPEVLGDMVEVEKRFPGISDEASLRIAVLEVMVADLIASGAGKFKEEYDQLRLQAGGMEMDTIQLREKLVIVGSKVEELRHIMAEIGATSPLFDEIKTLCKL